MGFQEGTDEKRWFLKVFLGSQVGAGGSQVRVLRKTSQRTAGWPRLVPHEAVGLCMPTAQGCYESWIMCAKHAAYFQASGENCQGVCAGVTAVLTVTASAVTGEQCISLGQDQLRVRQLRGINRIEVEPASWTVTFRLLVRTAVGRPGLMGWLHGPQGCGSSVSWSEMTAPPAKSCSGRRKELQ